ncbi:ABC transporter permease subunit [Anaerosalibacter bizertensis]|uniref:ABC transporter permease subunit n=1 Tax=Anaerosalibacter bizertensis TaxID=932217 RepID=A0A9Q4ADX4_9FIRM|nr:ABC transporter permease subunit [Anaerosalibacter bizertensis]MBV1819857.1 hypothetical protein [Bacteroidales bacterium MSK.15.36]MCG4565917.1 ABC transporter permease subunit [Anaerosalibacter bizertensis]MCG4583492.1 ABC transporter permease subunit [Anaerosalibacter bizertensis]HHV26685.1 hypothetical protein [Tissierellia bacterium]
MDKLFLWEWKKINKLILCFILLISLFIMSILIILNAGSMTWIDSSGKKLSGKSAIDAKIATVSNIEGKVTSEKLINYVNEYKKFYKEGKEEDNKEYVKYCQPFEDYINRLVYPIYNDGNQELKNLITNLSNDELNNFYSNWDKAAIEKDGKHYTILENKAKKVDKPFIYEYNDGLFYLVDQFKDLFLFAFIVIAIVLSSIFSEDSLQGLEEVSMSTKYGRERLVIGKLKCGIFLSIVVYILFLLVMNIIVGSIFTLRGGNTSIQFINILSLWNISMGKGYLLLIFLGLLATMTMALFVMYISVKSRKSKRSLLLSFGLVIIPYIFLSEIEGTFLTPILGVIPINLIDAHRIFGSNIFYGLGSFQFPYIIISIILSVAMIFLTIKGIKKEVRNYKL